jgi:hypothetical protein
MEEMDVHIKSTPAYDVIIQTAQTPTTCTLQWSVTPLVLGFIFTQPRTQWNPGSSLLITACNK